MANKTEEKEIKTIEQPEGPETQDISGGPTSILPHIASRLFGMPLALSQNKLNVVMSIMLPRLSGEMKFDAAHPAVRSQAFGDLSISRSLEAASRSSLSTEAWSSAPVPWMP
jgi:hypothetical protein